MVFQFTPLREGRRDVMMHTSFSSIFNFNSRPCERGDVYQLHPQNLHEYFNSRPCERGDMKGQLEEANVLLFQFTPLREGRLYHSQIYMEKRKYFNSRPCERGDQQGPQGPQGPKGISIHAPARGATF